MDIKKIRLANAKNLSESVGGQARFGETIDRGDSQVNQIIGENPVRNIGHRMARRIEDKFQKPEYWLDELHPEVTYGVAASSMEERPTGVKDDLSPTEERILNMWRGWCPAVKQYVFGQMKIADYTRDLLAGMFIMHPEKTITHDEIDEHIIDTVSEAGEFKALPSPQKRSIG